MPCLGFRDNPTNQRVNPARQQGGHQPTISGPSDLVTSEGTKRSLATQTEPGQGAERVQFTTDATNSSRELYDVDQELRGVSRDEEDTDYGGFAEAARNVPSSGSGARKSSVTNYPTDKFFNYKRIFSLNSCTYNEFVPGQEAAYVLFYDPKDSKSCISKKSYVQAASRDYNAVYAAVNCAENRSLCAEQNATSYPVVKFFKQGFNLNVFGMKDLLDNALPQYSANAPSLEQVPRPQRNCNQG